MMTPTWLEWFRAIYPVIVTLISLAGLGLFLWLATKFVGKAAYDKHCAEQLLAEVDTRTKLEGLNLTAANHEGRIKHLEDALEAAPTRQELQDDINQLAASMKGVEAAVHGLEKRLDTNNDYLHTLIQNGLAAAGRPK